MPKYLNTPTFLPLSEVEEGGDFDKEYIFENSRSSLVDSAFGENSSAGTRVPARTESFTELDESLRTS